MSMFKPVHSSHILALLFLLVLFTISFADEGMWTFHNPPIQYLRETYGFEPDQQWLDHVRLASVRFMNGGSGSFVSPQGLVLTNHHVAMDQLQKLSSEEHDYVADGFYGPEEIQCPDLEVNVLIAMEDVTDRITHAVGTGMSETEAMNARRAEMARIEKESLDQTGLRSEVIELYYGGEYWLYRYRKYIDVRLVMAPERQAAAFGGDPDNFTYPRYDLDFALFRIYENDEPVRSDHFFKWNAEGAGQGELVFASGNPGSTDRLLTHAQLELERDVDYPMIIDYLEQRVQAVRAYAQRGPEQQRRAVDEILGLENSIKAYSGGYRGLKDPQIMSEKQKYEMEFRQRIERKPEWKKAYGKLFDEIEKITRKQKDMSREDFYAKFRGSRMANLSAKIVRYVSEVNKPDSDRLEGYHDSELDELKMELLSPAPIYKDLEEVILISTLQLSLNNLGADHPFIKTVLDGRSPEVATQELIAGSRLDDSNFRKALIDGGEAVVNASDDPLIVVSRKLDPILAKREKRYREEIESSLDDAYQKIARARFAIYGKDIYPDATFTLRLSLGTVNGYPMNGTMAPYKTTLYGLYDRCLGFDQKDAFALPSRFWERIGRLNLSTPVNFVCSCDGTGGSSGSPVFNKNAELVGLLFDGNIESLVGDFIYDDRTNRSVAVHAACIIEALQQLYDCEKLADEILNAVPVKQ